MNLEASNSGPLEGRNRQMKPKGLPQYSPGFDKTLDLQSKCVSATAPGASDATPLGLDNFFPVRTPGFCKPWAMVRKPGGLGASRYQELQPMYLAIDRPNAKGVAKDSPGFPEPWVIDRSIGSTPTGLRPCAGLAKFAMLGSAVRRWDATLSGLKRVCVRYSQGYKNPGLKSRSPLGFHKPRPEAEGLDHFSS